MQPTATQTGSAKGVPAVAQGANAPVAFGRLHVLPIVNDFLLRFPEINVRMTLSDKNIDLIEDHIDMAVRIEEAKASSLKCTLSMDADAVTRARAASSAKTKVARCGRYVAEQAVQLHGGMGVTEELEVNAYFKRLLAIEVLFGSSDHHLRRHAKLAKEEA